MEHKEHTEHHKENNSVINHKVGLSTPLAIIIGALIIGICVFAGLKSNTLGGSGKGNYVDPDSLFSGREIKPDEIIAGNAKSKVIVLEYSDLECPFCKKIHVDTLNHIEKTFASSVGFAFRHFPLSIHPKAVTQAQATLCAREQKGVAVYKQFIDKIFEVTPANNGLDPKVLTTIATDLGLDMTAFAKCMSANTYQDYIKADTQDGVNVGVQGTPHLLVLTKQSDGSYFIYATISGARDIQYVTKVLNQAIASVK